MKNHVAKSTNILINMEIEAANQKYSAKLRNLEQSLKIYVKRSIWSNVD